MKHSLSLGSIIGGRDMEEFLERMDEAAADWLGLEDEDLEQITHITVTFETPE